MNTVNKLPIYQIDAFTHERFKGNPAAVIPLESWLDDSLMQQIAEENNLSETAFYVADNTENTFELRWFTPTTEVDFCGHATLATAWVLFNEFKLDTDQITFNTRSGELIVSQSDEYLCMDFPARIPIKVEGHVEPILTALGVPRAVEVLSGEDYMVVVETEAEVAAVSPDFNLLAQLDLRGVIVTAPGQQVDFVSRWFGPNVGVNEDPVTGSAHTLLTPYWATRMDKLQLSARQISHRGGEILCEFQDKRVILKGQGVKTLQGSILY